MGERQVPPPIDEAHERISGRPYDSDFARLPEEETVRDLEPGAGPRGTVGGRNVAAVVLAAGFGLVFATLLVQHWLALVAGFAVIVAGVLLALWGNRPLRLNRGVGPVRVRGQQRG